MHDKDHNLIWETYKESLLQESKLTLELVEELKNEFDTLISNIPTRIKSNNISNLIQAFVKVENKHDRMIEIFARWEKNKNLNAEYLRKPWWLFILSLNKVRRLLTEYSKNPNESNLKPLVNIKRVITKEAKLTWHYMDLFVRNHPDIDANLIPSYHEEVIGTIPFIFIGINDSNKRRVNTLKEYINYYIERAKKVAPLMLKYKLPVEVHMEFTSNGDSNAAGLYHYDKIVLTAWASKADDKYSFTHTLAHEMGHHLYKSLSDSSREFWDKAIRGDMGSLNVKEVIAMMHDGEKPRDFENRMKIENPILYLQAHSLFHGWLRNRDEIYDLPSLIDAYKQNKIGEEVRVPNTPITAYANKNPEESFCESISMLVAYGPRTVHEKIINLLKTILFSNEGYRFNESVNNILYESIIQKTDIENLLPDKNNMEIAIDSLRKGMRSVDDKPIEVYKSGDKYIVADGHHRLLQAIIDQKSSVMIKILDSDTPISRNGTIELDFYNGDYYGLDETLDNGWLIKRL